MPQCTSLGSDTVGSIEADEALQSLIPTESMTMPTVSQTAASIFSEVREGLESLQADIEDLSDGSDSFTESSGSDSETYILSGQHSDHTANNVREEPGAGSTGSQDLRANTEESASSSGSSPSHKRSQLDDDNEDHAHTEIATSRKWTKLSNLRFICCFHNGPGRKCSGTDDTISEVLKKLSAQHDTHVCGGCWVLKVKDESSGLFVHTNSGQACVEHCLSPQCHKTTPTVGYRHIFDQTTCGTKTSRVRPGDSEAVYRYIFNLIHPELDCPGSVLTTEHSLHLDAVPRQSRRRLNHEVLTDRANDLEKRLELGEKQNSTNANRIAQLDQQLADAHRARKAAEEKNAALEKQMRIIAMLSDALRTGEFPDPFGHRSLLGRVAEDAPSALHYRSQSFLTPPGSGGSQISSTAFLDTAPDTTSHGPMLQATNSQDLICEASLQAACDAGTDEYPSQGFASDLDLGDRETDFSWLEPFQEPGDSGVIPGS